MISENGLTKDEVIPQLWNEYMRSLEFRGGAIFSIKKDHPIIIRREKDGLRNVYNKYIRSAATQTSQTAIELVEEIKDMHDILFKLVLKDRGQFRKEDRRIGNPYDETLKLSSPTEIYPKIINFMDWLSQLSEKIYEGSLLEKSYILADIHLKLVMIHPFLDGNGRIARAVTDKYAIKMGLPTALAAHPRLNKEQQEKYHEAIYNSQKTGDRTPMMLWIKGYLDRIIEKIA